jgi:hypothetical protein
MMREKDLFEKNMQTKNQKENIGGIKYNFC